jgi:hypothetical protein
MSNEPSGLRVIATLWTLGSLFNLCIGFYGFTTDLGLLPLLSDPSAPGWVSFALPVELMLDFFMLALAYFALYIVSGLWTAKPLSWSWLYNAAYAIPVFSGIAILALTVLYMFISAEVDVGVSITVYFAVFLFDLAWIVAVWNFLGSRMSSNTSNERTR